MGKPERLFRFNRAKAPFALAVLLLTIKLLLVDGPWFAVGTYAIIGAGAGIWYLIWRRHGARRSGSIREK